MLLLWLISFAYISAKFAFATDRQYFLQTDLAFKLQLTVVYGAKNLLHNAKVKIFNCSMIKWPVTAYFVNTIKLY